MSTNPNLVGLPEHGLFLTGDPNSPTLINRTNRKIIGYTLRTQDANGHAVKNMKFLLLALRK